MTRWICEDHDENVCHEGDLTIKGNLVVTGNLVVKGTLTTVGFEHIGLHTFEELRLACLNVGVDLDCPACASIFYTGGTNVPHDCEERRRMRDDFDVGRC